MKPKDIIKHFVCERKLREQIVDEIRVALSRLKCRYDDSYDYYESLSEVEDVLSDMIIPFVETVGHLRDVKLEASLYSFVKKVFGCEVYSLSDLTINALENGNGWHKVTFCVKPEKQEKDETSCPRCKGRLPDDCNSIGQKVCNTCGSLVFQQRDMKNMSGEVAQIAHTVTSVHDNKPCACGKYHWVDYKVHPLGKEKDKSCKEKEEYKKKQKDKIAGISDEQKSAGITKEDVEIYNLAASMHSKYQYLSCRHNWQVQETTNVLFSDLPLANQKVMLDLAKWLKEEVIEATSDEAKSSSGCPKCEEVWNIAHCMFNEDVATAFCKSCGCTSPSVDTEQQIQPKETRPLSSGSTKDYLCGLGLQRLTKTAIMAYNVARNKIVEKRPFLLKLINERKNVKMRVLPQLSKEIQEWAFAHKIYWSIGERQIFRLDRPYLVFVHSDIEDYYCLFSFSKLLHFNKIICIEYDILNDCEMKEIK